MRNCTQPRPADHNSQSAPRQMPTPQGYSSSSPYAGSGGALFNVYGCNTLCCFSLQWNNYNSRLPVGNPYRPLQLSATPSIAGGPMIGTVPTTSPYKLDD
ncbi:Zinc finger, RanBP2-type [Artemisia annua]|uniref:Zinc finger, RanBP2-type n=1 Tax=Artemisia annua TaxID=35608 RepID=A0A2U1MC37_ARTAN|nr:Zinc finger, RanBP2-type [Artemisia annua]